MLQWIERVLFVATSIVLGSQAMASADARLAERLKQRFDGDRTGACVLAAVVEREKVLRARFCACPGQAPADDVAFEIGSISKTMTAFLVADLIESRGWTLDDPIARHLPTGTRVPRFAGHEIRVRHLVSHTAGLPPLPPGLVPKDARDPYAELTEEALLRALADTSLHGAPGTQAIYSNFGMMVLSLAVAHAYGGDLETALRTRLFEPLDMRDASVRRRAGAVWAQGHAPSGESTPAWRIAPNLAGVGMVRASLDDMVKYTQAQLGVAPTPLAGRMARTQQPLAAGFGMNWALPAMQGRSFVLHEGGTGGFSALVAFDVAARRGVVMLADTALGDLGGLSDAALPLLVDLPLGTPRRAMPTPERLLNALPGDYELPQANLRLTLWREEGQLKARANGQDAQTLGYDSRGDLYPLAASYLLTPVREQHRGGQVNRLLLRQGGGVIEAVRVGADLRPRATNSAWKDFAGEYILTPQFTLRVFEEAGQLKVQGTGQGPIVAEQTGPDRIEIKAVDAVIEFQRNDAAEVVRATLTQGGQTLSGTRKP